jgi:hypothetical protein
MSALFHSLLRRFGFGGQASRPAARPPQVRLSLEALDDRIVPTITSIDPGGMANSLLADYGSSLQLVAPISYLTSFNLPPFLAQTGANAFTSTINLGLGTLAVQAQTFNNNAMGVWNFAGTFESMTQIPVFGFLVSNDIGPLSFDSGQISSWPSSSGTDVFNGNTVNYFTNSISFRATGDGMVGDPSFGMQDHQVVSFTGSILSVWFNGQAVPVGVGGTIDIQDTVTVPGSGSMPFDTAQTVPGTMFVGMNWASIQH